MENPDPDTGPVAPESRGRVRRDGYYGKHKEFVRWGYVPGNGEPQHFLKRSQVAGLRPKLVGGRHGSRDECERVWEPTDGLPSASHDEFVLRAKAAALVRIAEGALSLRGAATEARRLAVELRTGKRPRFLRVSRDGRLTRDWVRASVRRSSPAASCLTAGREPSWVGWRLSNQVLSRWKE